MRCFMGICIAAAFLMGTLRTDSAFAQGNLLRKMTTKIEADPGKVYTLHKQHGPWMIMVASFHQLGSSEEKVGTTPEDAANALVLELRQQKIPAYVHSVKDTSETINTADQLGRSHRMKKARLIDSVCVLAGNYPGIEDAKGQDTLEFIKHYHPKCFKDAVVYGKSPGRPGPLSKAFLTPNPLLTDAEIEAAKQASDPLLVRLNNDERFSLSENPGKYTLVIAKFSGKSVNVVNETMEKAESYFTTGGNDLDQAGVNARNLVKALRSREPFTDPSHPDNAEFQTYCKTDAYIWHDRTSSIVTVGSFDSPNDPKIKQFAQRFGARAEVGANGKQGVHYRYVPIKEESGVLNFLPLDPIPKVIAVPKL
jgi:hypothetical protein